jgi:GntR family transcriptional regulator, rspAB operon transcriptional repressor
MTFKAPDSLAEQIAHHLAERIIRGELKPGERIQEQKVTLALNVSRGSVREALLILERRHLIAILPRRGAHVTELTAHKVQSLCTLMSELYILLGNAVAQRWAVPGRPGAVPADPAASGCQPISSARTSAPLSKTASM